MIKTNFKQSGESGFSNPLTGSKHTMLSWKRPKQPRTTIINKGQGPAEDHHQARKLSILPKANTRDQNCPAALAATHLKRENCLLRHRLSSRPTSMFG
ncbi:unnamed protein product, partial [Ectocarpus sp. 13 AM-2016]